MIKQTAVKKARKKKQEEPKLKEPQEPQAETLPITESPISEPPVTSKPASEPLSPITLESLQQEIETIKLVIIQLQETLSRKRRPPATNNKIQILDKQTNTLYPSKNNAYQTLLKSGELQILVDKGIFGDIPQKNTFGWYVLAREWPERFEEVPHTTARLIELAMYDNNITKSRTELNDNDIREIMCWVGMCAVDTMLLEDKPLIGRIGIGLMVTVTLLEFPGYYIKHGLSQFN